MKDGVINDEQRINYLNGYIHQVLKAKEEGINKVDM